MASKMEKRLPVTDQTHKRMTEFKDIAGMTYDEAVNLLLDVAVGEETIRNVAARLAYEVNTGKRPRPTGGDEPTEDDSRRRQIA